MTEATVIEIGTKLAGRYELVGQLAFGGLGTVYEALDLTSGAKAAVKVLHARYLKDDAMRRRFRREGAALKALDHPAIVRLLELGADADGVVYLVTEYVEGETLAERLSAGPLSIEEADALVSALCGGVGAAHAHGILHGDLKPANVLWGGGIEGASPRLVDFSASKILGLDRLTATGEISGTPAYMAPEVLTGEAEVDERIDIYGLGVLLYEALSGAQPFQEGHVGRLLMKIDAGDCLPLDAVANVPAPISRVISRAMHRDKTQRHRSAEELEAAWRESRGT
jgi:serine/threonine protein kinase